MRLLLDTHAFIWLDLAKDRLSTSAQKAILNPQNILHLSLASVWEMQIKVQLDKLHLNNTLANTLIAQQERHGIQLLPIQLGHILAIGSLPSHHQDPFDRLVIAQAKVEGFTRRSHNCNRIANGHGFMRWFRRRLNQLWGYSAFNV